MVNDDDQIDYTSQVYDRAHKLIQTGVWNGIKEQRLDSWLGCFKNHGAELLGAYLLDNLCFRSHDQFSSMLDTLFLHKSAVLTGMSDDETFVRLLARKPGTSSVNGIRLAPVIGLSSPPTKSGPYILRLAQRRFGIHSDWLTWPHSAKSATPLNELVFIDDFCGSGEQFTKFCLSIGLAALRKANPKLDVTYLVAAAHTNGIQKINREFPFMHIRCAECLGAVNSVLSPACFARYQIDGFEQLVIEQYQRVVSSAGLPSSGKVANGFGDLGLAYGFAHATPNNTLPIFWMETDHWTPLLDR